MRLQRWAVARFVPLQHFSMFFDKTFSPTFGRTFAPALLSPFRLFVRFALCVPLAVSFPSNVCNVHSKRFLEPF